MRKLNTIKLSNKIPISIALVIVAAFFALGFILTLNDAESKNGGKVIVQNNPCKEFIRITQNNGYDFIHPLLIAEMPDPSMQLSPIKQQIEKIVQKVEKEGVKDFSVYLLRQNSGEWTGVNEEKQFNSSGYIRLSILITYLKMAEEHPGILQKKLRYTPTGKHPIELPISNYYSVQELLKIMMTSEDTTAKYVLAQNINPDELAKLFKVLNLNTPDFSHRKFSLTVTEYSKFLQILYNANYLDNEDSEYALSLLYDSSGQRNGIMKFLPEGSKSIHKFSERFNNNQFELRESGIIYSENDTYLLTVFAAGDNKSALDSASGSIGRIVYDWIEGN